jgi:polysaccharide biosynthesis protein PslH
MSKRALYLSPERLDPPTSGGRMHAAALLTALGEHAEVVALTPDATDSSFPSWLRAIQRSRARRASKVRRVLDLVRGLAAGKHVVLERSERAGMSEALADVLRITKPDVVVLGRPFFGEFIDVCLASGASVVVDADESLVRVARSIYRSRAPLSSRLRALVDLAVVGRMERREYPRVDQIWVTSEIERRHFLRYMPSSAVVTMPNVVPSVSVDPGGPMVHHRAAAPVQAVAFVGWYGYPPNEAAAFELASKIMPVVRALGGPKKLALIGRDPTSRMLRFARDGEVVVTGEVADVVPHLREAGLLAVPLRAGGGTRVKILEAAAAGVPVVSTRFGIEGLGLGPEDGILLADDPEDFARALVRVAADAELRVQMADRALAALDRAHSPVILSGAIGRALATLRTEGGR